MTAFDPQALRGPPLPRGRDVLVAAVIAIGIAAPAFATGVAKPVGPAMLSGTLLLGVVLVALGAIDAASQRLPDVLTLPLVAAGLLIGWAADAAELSWRLAAALSGFTMLWLVARSYRSLRGRAGLGLGDAKLFAAAGAWTGLEGLPWVLLFASLTALIAVGLARLAGREVTSATAVAFGPFLAIGMWVVWLYGPPA